MRKSAKLEVLLMVAVFVVTARGAQVGPKLNRDSVGVLPDHPAIIAPIKTKIETIRDAVVCPAGYEGRFLSDSVWTDEDSISGNAHGGTLHDYRICVTPEFLKELEASQK